MAPDAPFTLAAAGDALITRRLSAYEDRIGPLVEEIRDADAGVVNLEMLLHDYEGYPASNRVASFSGMYLRAPPYVADELQWAGFDLFAAANNHTGDYSHGGMAATMRELEDRDIPYAGLGRNLADAREPAYFDTPAGRVALVGAASTVAPGTEAGPQRRDLQGRPGVSPLLLETRHEVSPDSLDALRAVSEELGLEAIKERREAINLPHAFGDSEDVFQFLEIGRGHSETLLFEAGDDPGVYQDPVESDVEAILDQIRGASRQSDWVVMSLHAHEGENGAYNDETVALFRESFARRCIDAGADAFVGHGPHTLHGVEVYDGAPIFHSLGNFVAQHETITRFPNEVYDRYGFDPEDHPSVVCEHNLPERGYWEAVVPVCEFDDGSLDRATLHPVELGFDDEPPRHGLPVPAEGEDAERILGRLAALSEPYGTEIEFADGVGVVEP